MKTTILCIVITFIIQSTGYSQWYKLNPYFYQSVDFVDQNTGYLAGVGGVIRKTTDGGNTWNFQNTGTTTNLSSICFVNNDTGFSVGPSNTLLKTTNGGEEWTAIHVNQNVSLRRCYFFDDSTGFAVSYYNIIKTTDGGISWITKFTGNQGLYDMKFLDQYSGYAVGDNGIILRTNDGGESWIEQFFNVNDNNFNSVSIIDSLNCIAVGEKYYPEYAGIIFKTTDGGDSWFELNSFLNRGFLSSFFIDNYIGVIGCSDGTIGRTTNGGTEWTFNNFGLANGVLEIDFVDSNNGFATGYNLFIRTTNAGETWFNPTDFPNENLQSAYFSNQDTGFVVGYSGAIYKTLDSGINWMKLNTAINNNLNSIVFTDENSGVVVGDDGRILKTTDAGANWIVKTSGTSSNLNSVCFPTSNIGYIVGNIGKILKTTNSGEDWTSQLSGVTVNLYAVEFFNKDSGLAVGSNSYVLRTSNGGANWQISYIQGTPNSYIWNYCLDIVDQNIVYTAGSYAGGSLNIWKSNDGGSSWVGQRSGDGNAITSLFFQSPTIGYAVKSNQILFTTNGGNNWAEQQHFNFNYLSSIFFVDENTGFVVGQGGAIFRTTNSGITPVELILFTGSYSDNSVKLSWTTATELNNHGFEIERSSDKTTWRLIGFKEGNGTTTETHNYSFTDDLSGSSSSKLYYRLKQVDFDGSFEYSDIVEVDIAPSTYSLSQNYPNPFNPSTKIKYSIPNAEIVTIKVYDVLGKEVATLVNEQKPAGNYEVEFNASNLPSGIYFYQLKTSSFVETRKMVLLK